MIDFCRPGYIFAPTGYVTHCCVIGHCVGVMAVHGVPQGVVFATSHPTHPCLFHPNLPCLALLPIPPTPSISILMAERDGKNIMKFSYQR